MNRVVGGGESASWRVGQAVASCWERERRAGFSGLSIRQHSFVNSCFILIYLFNDWVLGNVI